MNSRTQNGKSPEGFVEYYQKNVLYDNNYTIYQLDPVFASSRYRKTTALFLIYPTQTTLSDRLLARGLKKALNNNQ